MNMNFYHMTHGYSNHYARAKGRIGKYERHPCEVCEANHIIELENTRVEIHGKKHADYYWIPGRHIISPAFQQLLEENKVSGYHLQDIQLVDCDDFSQEGLKEMVVTGRSGYLKDINGNYYKRCPKCDAIDYDCRDGTIGTLIDEWDGSDMFYSENLPGFLFVTEDLMNLIKKNKITNAFFKPVEEIKWV